VTGLYGLQSRSVGKWPYSWLHLGHWYKPIGKRLLLGIAVLVSGTGLTAYLAHPFSWWSLLTGYVAFMGMALISSGFDKRHQLAEKYSELGKKAYAQNGMLDPLDHGVVDLVQKIRDLDGTPGDDPFSIGDQAPAGTPGAAARGSPEARSAESSTRRRPETSR
jgi:hypothetical protein